MTDIVVYRTDKPWAEPKLEAFIKGLRVHGQAYEQRSSGNWRASDLAVVWGHRDFALHEFQRFHGGRYLVLERAYIGDIHARRRWTSIGYDGLNGNADFCNSDSPSDRWDEHFAGLLKPWKSEGGYAVVMGQVGGDASIIGINMRAWYEEAVANLTAEWKLPVVFRPHPSDPNVPVPYGAAKQAGELADCLAGARVVATYNSNTGVDAVLAGVPTIARDSGSMVWGLAAYDYDHCALPSRVQWAANLAYTQWLEEEIVSGEAWEHLKGGVS